MLNRLHSNEQIGLIGPVSNNISGPQQVPTSYRHLNELDGSAWDWGKQHNGKSVEVDRLVGFCLLFKREVIERIGLLDERFGIGNFEDDDFCRRAAEAGYQSLIAIDCFVHHFGSVSFQGAGVDLNQVLQENQKLYREKWEGTIPQGEVMIPSVEIAQESFALGKRRSQFTLESTSGGLKLQPNTIKLSACLIVRDNENTIRPCLESIKPWVDEIVVVDTGSKDQTAQICEEMGARVFHWPWRDDFSAARNESIDHARGEWIFWMDSDDTIPEHCGKQLRELADSAHTENVLGYVAQVHCPGMDSMDITAVDHVKLFRNHSDLRFEFRIHEQIIPSIRRAGGEVAWTDLYVVHSGSDQTEKGRAGKLVRDFRLLEKELADRLNHPFVLFNLGMTHADAKQFESAVEYLVRCIDVTGPEESHLCKTYALLVNALSQLNRNEQAWEVVNNGLKLFPEDKELMFRQALLQHHFGYFSDSEQTYLRILSEQTDRKFASVDQGISNFKARHNLAVVYEDAGRHQEAEQQWRIIIKQYPEYIPAWRGLGENLLTQNKNEELSELINILSDRSDVGGIIQYFLGKLASHSDEHAQARKYFEAGLQLDPDDTPTLNELCRLHFEHGNPIDSQQHLHQLISINPEDSSAQTNLGVVLMTQQKYEAAAQAFETSLKHRPNHPEAMQYLDYCRENLGLAPSSQS